MNEKILNHFKKSDPILYTYALKVRELMPIEMSQPEQYFLHLCMQIMSQQLSDKAGDAIFARFRNLFSNNTILPSEVISMPHEKLRGTGMSHAKARYIKHLAQDIISGSLPLSDLHTMKDEEIIQVLTRVKGIGRWTAEMFLMFALGREDVFSFGDLGLKKGIMKVYGFRKEPARKRIEIIVKKWSPFKTFASRTLWASLRS